MRAKLIHSYFLITLFAACTPKPSAPPRQSTEPGSGHFDEKVEDRTASIELGTSDGLDYLSGCAGMRIEGSVRDHVRPNEWISLQGCEEAEGSKHVKFKLRIGDIGNATIYRLGHGNDFAYWPSKMDVAVEAAILEKFSVSYGTGRNAKRHTSLPDEGPIRVGERESFDCDWGWSVPTGPNLEVAKPMRCVRIPLTIDGNALGDAQWLSLGWVDAFRH